MITFFLILGLIISIGLNIVVIILIRNLLNKIVTYETYIREFKSNLTSTINTMRDIDKEGVFSTGINQESGLFESNDPTSQIFKELLSILENLDKITE